jgi:hypothetical protein
MKKILHILVSDNALPREIIEAHGKIPDTEVTVENLGVENPDYDSLVRKIFESDSVEVW